MSELNSLSSYSELKDSGVEWLEKIPEHWGIAIAKHVLSKLERPRKRNGNTVICSNHGITKLSGDVNQGLVSLTQHDYQGVNEGDLLVHGMDAWHGAISISMHTGDCTSVVHVCDTKHNKIYIAYYLKMLAIRNVYKVLSNGVRQNTSDFRSWSKFGDIQILLPPLEEQDLIAEFLDKKVKQVEEVIVIKKKQIELLKERKKIIIQQAVTQGISYEGQPDVPMKDSGVDWIGEIPEHWQVKRAKYLFNEIDERSENGDEELLSVSHLTGVTPRSEKSVTMIAEDYSGSKTCQKNDFVMNIMWAWMGAMGVSDRPGIVSSAYSVFRQTPLDTFNPVYLEWLLKTVGYIEHYNKVSTGLHSSRLRFYSRMFFDMEIGYPSRNEQDEIVTHIEKQSFKIDESVELQKQQIEKLKEYKTTLINSVVTGKIKVI